MAFPGEDKESLLEPSPAIFARMTGDHMVRRNKCILEETRDHRLGHNASTDEGDVRVAKGSRAGERVVLSSIKKIAHVRPPLVALCHHCTRAGRRVCIAAGHNPCTPESESPCRTAWPLRRVPICCSTPRILSTGTRGGTRRLRKRVKRTNRFWSVSATPRATGVT